MIDPATVYGSTVEVQGRRVEVLPRVARCEPGAHTLTPSLIAEAKADGVVLVLSDARTHTAAGDELEKILEEAGFSFKSLRVPDPHPGASPVCDDATMQWVRGECASAGFVLAVGSGVINDLAKWASFEERIPYGCVATAASMNGYTSANVAATVNGVKILVHAAPPQFVLAEPRVLAAAPTELTASGLGDIIAKSVSSADWWLNHRLFGDEFVPECIDLIADIEPLYFDRPEAIRDGDESALRALFDGLMLTGVAMTLAGSSTPASGGEHLVSHTLDMMERLDGAAHDLHGRQVGVGTVLTSELYQRVLAWKGGGVQDAPLKVDAEFWGPLASEVQSQYDKKRERLEHFARLAREDAEGLAAILEECRRFLRPPDVLKDRLSRAAAAHRAEDLGIGRQRLTAALLHGREMRARFTILDAAWILGVMPGAADEVVERWA